MTYFQQQIQEKFERLVPPLRRLGWWVALDYVEGKRLTLCANHLRFENQYYSCTAPQAQHCCPVEYETWLYECFYLLYDRTPTRGCYGLVA